MIIPKKFDADIKYLYIQIQYYRVDIVNRLY